MPSDLGPLRLSCHDVSRCEILPRQLCAGELRKVELLAGVVWLLRVRVLVDSADEGQDQLLVGALALEGVDDRIGELFQVVVNLLFRAVIDLQHLLLDDVCDLHQFFAVLADDLQELDDDRQRVVLLIELLRQVPGGGLRLIVFIEPLVVKQLRARLSGEHGFLSGEVGVPERLLAIGGLSGHRVASRAILVGKLLL